GAHLAGTEVEVRVAVHVGDGRALGPRDHRQREVAGKAADEHLAGLGEQLVALAIAHGKLLESRRTGQVSPSYHVRGCAPRIVLISCLTPVMPEPAPVTGEQHTPQRALPDRVSIGRR